MRERSAHSGVFVVVVKYFQSTAIVSDITYTVTVTECHTVMLWCCVCFTAESG